VTRGDQCNLAYLAHALSVDERVPGHRLSLLLDPQTSGGLLMCVDARYVEVLLRKLEERGSIGATIGTIVARQAGHIRVL
jgi:selenophosphate synthase